MGAAGQSANVTHGPSVRRRPLSLRSLSIGHLLADNHVSAIPFFFRRPGGHNHRVTQPCSAARSAPIFSAALPRTPCTPSLECGPPPISGIRSAMVNVLPKPILPNGCTLSLSAAAQ